MIRKPVLAGLVHIPAISDCWGQGNGAERVVVAISVTCPADPAVFYRVRVQVPEGVDEAMLGIERPVEVVFERGEEWVMRPMAGLKDVQVPEEHGWEACIRLAIMTPYSPGSGTGKVT